MHLIVFFPLSEDIIKLSLTCISEARKKSDDKMKGKIMCHTTVVD